MLHDRPSTSCTASDENSIVTVANISERVCTMAYRPVTIRCIEPSDPRPMPHDPGSKCVGAQT